MSFLFRAKTNKESSVVKQALKLITLKKSCLHSFRSHELTINSVERKQKYKVWTVVSLGVIIGREGHLPYEAIYTKNVQTFSGLSCIFFFKSWSSKLVMCILRNKIVQKLS